MYFTHTKTIAVEAFKTALTHSAHPIIPLLKSKLWVGMEYPNQEINYPGIWVDYTPNGQLQSSGIGHVEYRVQEDGTVQKGTRWNFSGTIQATVVAMKIKDRDELMDEVIRLFAFSEEHPVIRQFRSTIEQNDLVALNAQFDRLSVGGVTQSYGTPWGTDDMVAEGTISFSVHGEFVSDLSSTASLVPLTQIVVEPHEDLTPGAPQPPPDDGWY